MTRGRLETPADVRAFVTAGDATFTLVSARTGARFTYRVRRPKDDGPLVQQTTTRGTTMEFSFAARRPKHGPLFVSLLSGPDNESSYTYLGVLDEPALTFRRTRASRVGDDAPSVVALKWALARLGGDALPPELEVWHEGRCGRCHRKLTVPESIASGLGPICAGRAA